MSKLTLRKFLMDENRQKGVTMILTTHDMHDIEALCSIVMVIGKGELLYDGKLNQLKQKYSDTRCIHASFYNEIDKLDIPYDVKANKVSDGWNIYFNPDKVSAQKIMSLMTEKMPIHDMYVKENNIDEIIAAMYVEMSI